jgi:hypothetical protein
MDCDGEPTSADVKARYPGWVAYYGSAGGLCHARLAGTTLTVAGDSWQDVLDAIPAALARSGQSRPREARQ